MGVRCQVLLDNDGAHKPGDIVVGTAKCIIDKPIELKDIILSVLGKGQCWWAVNKGSLSTTHTGTEEYIQNDVSLLERSGEDTITLPVGVYSYPFSFPLPDNIPSSYMDPISSISYTIVLKFVKSCVFSRDKSFSTNFIIREHVNPPIPLERTIFGIVKQLSSPLSAKMTKITVSAEMATWVLKSGASADLRFVVNNSSNVSTAAIQLQLHCYTSYTANTGGLATVSHIVAGSTIKTPPIPKSGVSRLAIKVPISSELYSIVSSKIIHREYRLKVKLKMPFPYTSSEVFMPVLIGEMRNEKVYDVIAKDRVEENITPSYWQAIAETAEKKSNKAIRYFIR